MIDVKEAVALAKAKALEMLGDRGSLEEVEKDSFKGMEAWSITLGFFPTNPNVLVYGGLLKEYKRFLIDAETGEFLAMKLRELASR